MKGKVHVFHKNSNTGDWEHFAFITNDNNDNDFGSSVSISAQGDDVKVMVESGIRPYVFSTGSTYGGSSKTYAYAKSGNSFTKEQTFSDSYAGVVKGECHVIYEQFI